MEKEVSHVMSSIIAAQLQPPVVRREFAFLARRTELKRR